MKIVHFYNSLYIGGIDSFLIGLANEMSRTENVSICTLQPPKEGGMRNLLDNQVSFYTINDTKFSIWHKIKDIFKIARFIQKNQFDIVHIHAAFNFYILSILLFHRKTKFFYTIHSDAIMENGPISTRLLKIKKIFFKRKLITPITISKTSQESFYKLYNCDSLLIENGILRPNLTNTNPILQYKTSIHTRVFTHVGRICEAKNQLVLCKVFDRLIQEGKDIVIFAEGTRSKDGNVAPFKAALSSIVTYSKGETVLVCMHNTEYPLKWKWITYPKVRVNVKFFEPLSFDYFMSNRKNFPELTRGMVQYQLEEFRKESK